MKRVIPVISQKGGVGKSTVARALVDISRAAGIVTAAFDADGGVGQLLTHYGQRDSEGNVLRSQDPLVGVGYFRARDERGRDALVNVIDAKANVIVIDLPGGSIDAVADVVPGGIRGLTELWAEEGWEVRPVHVITPLKACAVEVLRMIELFGPFASDLRVIRNLGGPDEQDAFYIFDGENGRYGTPRRQLEAVGGRVLNKPHLRARTYSWIDEYAMTFSQALHSTDTERRADRKFLRDWLLAFELELRESDVL